MPKVEEKEKERLHSWLRGLEECGISAAHPDRADAIWDGPLSSIRWETPYDVNAGECPARGERIAIGDPESYRVVTVPGRSLLRESRVWIVQFDAIFRKQERDVCVEDAVTMGSRFEAVQLAQDLILLRRIERALYITCNLLFPADVIIRQLVSNSFNPTRWTMGLFLFWFASLLVAWMFGNRRRDLRADGEAILKQHDLWQDL
jgi:hypothetical protein